MSHCLFNYLFECWCVSHCLILFYLVEHLNIPMKKREQLSTHALSSPIVPMLRYLSFTPTSYVLHYLGSVFNEKNETDEITHK